MTSIASSDPIVRGGMLTSGFDESFDAVVVGSGAGGSVVATHLAEAGWRVLVLEEGPYFTPSQYGQMRSSETVRRLWREAGLQAAFGVGNTPVIGIATGRCVGGSSVLTGGVCFRIPSHVHHDWQRLLGLQQLSEKSFEQAYEDVERRSHIEPVPEQMRAHPTRRLVQGAASIGITMHATRRNTIGCEGNARCNLGCPAQAKQSVDIAYLPAAIGKGARVVADALVERVLIRAGCAAGVEGRLIDANTRRPGHRFVARAPVVVVACGTLHTPGLLSRSGLRHSELGAHVTLHPAVRMSAMFDEPLDGHNGALQSVYSDQLAHEGLMIVGVHSTPNVLAAALPGIGASHRALVRQVRNLGVIGGMVHDKGGGRVRKGPGREPLLWYRMDPGDLTKLRRLITVLGEIAFAAGARAVFPPIFGIDGVRDVAHLRRLEHEPIDARHIECVAFHPLGSARMAVDPRGGIVGPTGESFAVGGLFVADGSVLPTSIGVNSQVPVMAMATKIAWSIRDRSRAPRSTGWRRLWERARSRWT